GIALSRLIETCDSARSPGAPLASSLRLLVLKTRKDAAAARETASSARRCVLHPPPNKDSSRTIDGGTKKAHSDGAGLLLELDLGRVA
ncbi:MAG: hypothetical protein AAGG79_06430, partial [Pseudomonadota bacterium]